MTDESSSSFAIQFSFKGRTVASEATVTTSAADLVADARAKLQLDDDDSATAMKLLYKGKRLDASSSANNAESSVAVFPQRPKTTPKIMVLVTPKKAVEVLNSKRSDPTIRGFDQEVDRKKLAAQNSNNNYWGPDTAQDKNYKFCRFESCSWQSFGHRPTDSTPHDFAARQMLERLATDPGIVAVMKTRELVVGTLGEMDPIDDRLMQQKQQQGGVCLLGYNTNGGQRIDVKLRTDDLKAFRPYPDLVATLIHELSHNWVGEHDLLFWMNYAQMRAEYLFAHVRSGSNGLVVVKGKTTAQLAELPSSSSSLRTVKDIFHFIMQELVHEMAQHKLHPNMIAQGVEQHCHMLEEKVQKQLANTTTITTTATAGVPQPSGNPRELALAAAERRAKEQRDRQKEQNNEKKKPKN